MGRWWFLICRVPNCTDIIYFFCFVPHEKDKKKPQEGKINGTAIDEKPREEKVFLGCK
jgi:hypothetical protein